MPSSRPRISILARRKAEVDKIHQPGLPAVVDELNPASISPDLIGRRLSLDDVIINKPPAPSVRDGALWMLEDSSSGGLFRVTPK